ncbi:hypothetical protein AB3S75_033553 [Citrus x aurantiifolia]
MVIMQFYLITNLCKQNLMVGMFTRGYWRLQGGFLMLSVSFCGRWLRGAKIILYYFLGIHWRHAGVVTFLVFVVQNLDKLRHIEKNKIRCFAIAPTTCMSLNLVVRYANVIKSMYH